MSYATTNNKRKVVLVPRTVFDRCDCSSSLRLSGGCDTVRACDSSRRFVLGCFYPRFQRRLALTKQASIKSPISVPASPSNAVKVLFMPRSFIELQ